MTNTIHWEALYVVDINTQGSYAATALTLGELVRWAEAGSKQALACLRKASFDGDRPIEWDDNWLVEEIWSEGDPRWDEAHAAPFAPVDWTGCRERVEAALAAAAAE